MGEWFTLRNSQTVPLTMELAVEFRDMQPSPTERELDEKRVKFLREKAEAGLLVNFNWSTATLGNQKWRTNGRTSSTMLTGLNGQFPNGLRVHLDEYEVTSLEGLVQLFRQFDPRQSGRTAKDVAGAYQGLYEPLQDVERRSAKLAAEGVKWWRVKVDEQTMPAGDDLYQIFAETALHGFVRFVGDLLDVKTPELRRAPVIAAMHATWLTNELQARSFWSQVARGGVEFEDEAPSTVLDCWLKQPKTGVKAGDYYQGCIFAWNAFRRDHSLTKINFKHDKGFTEPAA